MRLPDMELVVNLGDWPLNTAARMPLYPVFSWCGSPVTRDIIWPTWDIMKSTVMGLERCVSGSFLFHMRIYICKCIVMFSNGKLSIEI